MALLDIRPAPQLGKLYRIDAMHTEFFVHGSIVRAVHVYHGAVSVVLVMGDLTKHAHGVVARRANGETPYTIVLTISTDSLQELADTDG